MCIKEVCCVNLLDCDKFSLAAENFPGKSIFGDKKNRPCKNHDACCAKKKKKPENFMADKALV